MIASFIFPLAFFLHVDGSQDEVYLRSGPTSGVKSEASALHHTHAAEVLCLDRNASPVLQNGSGMGISSIDVGCSKSPQLFQHIAGPSNNGIDAVEEKQVPVEQTILVSAPHAVSDQLNKVGTTDVEESKLLSKEADLRSPSRTGRDQRDSRSANLILNNNIYWFLLC